MKRAILGTAIVCALTASAAFAGKPTSPVDPIAYTDAQIAIERLERQAADSGEVTDRNAAISAAVATEKSERQAADTSEATARNAAISAAVAIEKSERQAADTSEVTARNAAISTAVGNEKSERLAGEAGLQAQIDALPGSGPKTRTVNFSAAAFNGTHGNDRYINSFACAGLNAGGYLYADVPVPVGATITGFSASFKRELSTTAWVNLKVNGNPIGNLTVAYGSLATEITMSATLATPKTITSNEYLQWEFFTGENPYRMSICGASVTYIEP